MCIHDSIHKSMFCLKIAQRWLGDTRDLLLERVCNATLDIPAAELEKSRMTHVAVFDHSIIDAKLMK